MNAHMLRRPIISCFKFSPPSSCHGAPITVLITVLLECDRMAIFRTSNKGGVIVHTSADTALAAMAMQLRKEHDPSSWAVEDWPTVVVSMWMSGSAVALIILYHNGEYRFHPLFESMALWCVISPTDAYSKKVHHLHHHFWERHAHSSQFHLPNL